MKVSLAFERQGNGAIVLLVAYRSVTEEIEYESDGILRKPYFNFCFNFSMLVGVAIHPGLEMSSKDS
jgi:hypothetical protein